MGTPGEDPLNVRLLLKSDPLADGVGGIDALLDAIDAADWTPGQMKVGKTKRAYSRDALREELARRPSGYSRFALCREAEPPVSLDLVLYHPPEDLGFIVELELPLTWFDDADAGAARVAALLDVVRAAVGVSRIHFGVGHSLSDYALSADEPALMGDAPALKEMYWLELIGAETVERLGRARVMSTPAHSLEELPDGSVLLLIRPSPVDYASELAREAQARALSHLRPDLGYDETLERLRRRSAELAPVERRWDPDLEPLFELIAEKEGFARRAAVIAPFNDYHAPLVTEWRADPLPPDVDDIDAAIDDYDGLFAEQLIVLVHTSIPSVMKSSPDALPHIDRYFLIRRFPESYPRDDVDSLIPAVGAFLGKVLVRHFRGEWVPRRNLDEAQVVVNGRAWLPFLRARRYLASAQSLIDYSLTQYFRVASRSGADGAS